MSTDDFRALCAELLQPLAEYDSANPYHEHRALIKRAHAALAQPEGEGPSDAEGRCWIGTWSDIDGEPTFDWAYTPPRDWTWEGIAMIQYWLPHWALPLPHAREVEK